MRIRYNYISIAAFGFIMFQPNSTNLTEEPSSVDIELKKNVVYGVSQQGQPFVTMTNYTTYAY